VRRPAGAAAALVALLAVAGCSAEEPSDTSSEGAGAGEQVEVPGVSVSGDSAALSPDGSRLAVPCDGRLCVWSTADGSLEEQWDGGGVVAWSTADLIATDRVDGGTVDLVVLDATSGDEIASAAAYATGDVQDGPGEGMLDVAFSADGETVAGVGADGVVRLWPVADPAAVVEVDPEGDAPVAVAFAPDNGSIAIASSDAAVAVHDARTGEALGSLGGSPQGDVAWSADGDWIAAASFAYDDEAATTVWDAASREVAATLPRAGDHVAFTPRSDALVLSEKKQRDVLVWTWADDDVRTFPGATDDPRAVLVAPDANRVYAVSPRDGVLAWDAAGGQPTSFDVPEEG